MKLENLKLEIAFDEASDLQFEPFWTAYDCETGEPIEVTDQVRAAAYHMLQYCTIRAQQDHDAQIQFSSLSKLMDKK